jgi:hypothetical protein
VSIHQHAAIGDTIYFWAGSNDTSGSGADGASSLFDVREAGAAAGAAPLLSGSGTLLSHANYPPGCYEIAVAATSANGFADGDTCAVFFTLTVDSQNPTGFVGSFTLGPAPADVQEWLGTDVVDPLVTAKGAGLLFDSTISSATSQLSFVCTESIATNDNWVGNTVIVEDVSTGDTVIRYVADVVAAENRIIIDSSATFTVSDATPDRLYVRGEVNDVYANSLLNNLSSAEVSLALSNIGLHYLVDTALPTNWATDITSDSALDQLTSGSKGVNTAKLNNAAVLGVGTSGDKWRGS